ncbi:hypothetical protein ABZX62_10355 [Streptomyces flavidovirens]|uniref:hypothetical protein n=1 Tax=Streptomyces flavidovirens TaxID=67298 RepID=UPI00339E97A5
MGMLVVIAGLACIVIFGVVLAVILSGRSRKSGGPAPVNWGYANQPNPPAPYPVPPGQTYSPAPPNQPPYNPDPYPQQPPYQGR